MSLKPFPIQKHTLRCEVHSYTGWQAVFWKTEHLCEHERMYFMYTFITKQHHAIWWEMALQTEGSGMLLVLIRIQQRSSHKYFHHTSVYSPQARKNWWLKVSQLQVSLWLCPWREMCITGIQRCPESLSWGVTEEWQRNNRRSRGGKNPKKHEAS